MMKNSFLLLSVGALNKDILSSILQTACQKTTNSFLMKSAFKIAEFLIVVFQRFLPIFADKK